MEDYNGYETVRESLILAGIGELQKHSAEDLSLRKVSALCNVSCAAPYKHFKDKEEFIGEIVKYINCQWTKIRSRIIDIFDSDKKAQLIEVCTAYIKFCAANPNFRNVMVMTRNDKGIIKPEDKFYFSIEDNLIRKYCTFNFPDKDLAEEKIFKIHSIVYGAVYMTEENLADGIDEIIKKVRSVLEKELSA